jgi:hypothetical protein
MEIGANTFFCSLCGIEFMENQGQPPELVPGEFEEGMEYIHTLWARGIKTPIKIEVRQRLKNFMWVMVDGYIEEIVMAVQDGETEFMAFPAGWPMAGEKIYPYNIN